MMSRENTFTLTYNFPAIWFSMPPFVAFFTVLLAALFSSSATAPVNEALWALVGLLFIILSILYGLFLHQHFFRGLIPVQVIAQGLLLCPVSLRMGARMMEWLGVTMAICGTVALVVIYHRLHAAALSAFHVVPSPEFSVLPLLCATTNGEGIVVSISDALLHLAHRTRETTEGASIASFLPKDGHNVTLDGREWEIFQSPMEGGMFYFQLEEARHDQALDPLEGSDSFTDPVTSLLLRGYVEQRINEELYRTRRYKRPMSAVLLRMTFQGTEKTPDKEDEIFNAYCRYIRSSTRESDISCIVGEREVFVALTETQLTDAVDVTGKLTDFVPHLQEHFAGFDGAAEVRDAVVFVDSSLGELDFEGLVEKLYDSLNG